MKKLKKLFLSTALASSLFIVAGALTSNAEESSTEPTTPEVPELTENFSFVEEFDLGDGTIDGYGGANNHNIYANNKQDLITTQLIEKDNLEVLNIKTLKNTAQSGKISFRDNASASSLYNKEGGQMVLKFKFNIDHGREQHFGLYMSTADGLAANKTYELLRMRDDGTYYRLGNGTWVKMTTLTGRVSKNEWHEATFILQDNGDLVEGKSQDKIIGFLDGKFIYETNFADGDNFCGKLTEFFYNMPTSNTSADINAYIDYVRIGDYNAPIATAPTVTDVKVSNTFTLNPTFTGTDSDYLPSVIPNYTIDFNLDGKDLEATITGESTVYKLEEEAIIEYNNGKYMGLKAVDNIKATFNFDSDFLAPIDVTFDIAENYEPILVEEIVVSKIVKDDNTLTLAVGEKFTLSNLFKASPSTADDLTLSYANSDDTVLGIEEGVLTGVAPGTAKLTVTANGGENVKKEITVHIVKGSFGPLNGATVEDSWAEAEVTHGYFISKAYTNKEYSPISVVADPIFGNVIKFTGVGGKNGGGSHLDAHISSENLVANKDYKLTGWIKMDVVAGVDSASRIDFKLFNYFNAGAGKYGYSSNVAPYYAYASKDLSQLKNDWIYFETSAINFDTNALTNAYIGLKVEIGTYNTQVGVDSYIAHLNLVELDTITTAGWEIVDSNHKVLADKTVLTQTVGDTFQLNTVALPSSGSVNATFQSSDETIATVAANGLVTFLNKAGSVNIVVTNNGISRTITFNVQNPATDISSEEDTLELGIGDAFKDLNITVTPADSTSKFKVTVADNTICSAEFTNGKLVVVPNGIGTTTITIISEDNEEIKLTITIVVKGYTVTYNVQGHGTAPETLTDATKLPNELPSLTADGYVFEGWFLDSDCTQEAKAGTDIETNTTLYAKWSVQAPTTFTITYNINGHGTAVNPTTNTTALPALLPTLTEEGWEFKGWFTDSNCTVKAEAGKTITEDTTLYAKWEKIEDKTEDDNPGTTTPEEPKDSGVNVVAIVVPIVVIVVLAVAGALVYFLVFKKKEQKPSDKE